MAKYYNTTRGPIPLSLSGGKSTVVTAKSFVDVDSDDDGCEELLRAVRRGDLRKMPSSEEPIAAPVVSAEVTVAVAPLNDPSPPGIPAPEELPAPEGASEPPSPRRRRG